MWIRFMIPDSENQRIEFKETWKDEFLEWICCFANANGGTIYVGVNDQGRAVGLKNAKRLLEDIPNKIVATLGIVCDIQLQQGNGAEYLVIEVKPSQVPVSCRGVYHYRSVAYPSSLRSLGRCFAAIRLIRTGQVSSGTNIRP